MRLGFILAKSALALFMLGTCVAAPGPSRRDGAGDGAELHLVETAESGSGQQRGRRSESVRRYQQL